MKKVEYFSCERVGDVIVIEFKRNLGALNSDTAVVEWDALIETLASEGWLDCLVDLTHASYLGATAVNLLVKLWNGLQDLGKRLALARVSAEFKQMINEAGYKGIWYIYEDREQGLQLLEKGNI